MHAVAWFEAAKGAVVLLAGTGALSLVHGRALGIAAALIERLHLNPAHRYPLILLKAASEVTDVRLWLLAGGAALYALVRFVEAYGLWRARTWAEWFAAISGAIYIPFELFELARDASWLIFVALLVNMLVVAAMINVLVQTRRSKCDAGDSL